MKRLLRFLAGGELVRSLTLIFVFLVSSALTAVGGQELNVIKTVDVASGASGSSVKLLTEMPVGYRYTVYDSFDPVRVVVDFPGMDTSALEPIKKFSVPPIQEVRVSSFDLESGKLGRIEILLEQATSYEVELTGTQFQVLFAKTAPKVSSLGAKLSQAPQTSQPVAAAVETSKAAPEMKPADEARTEDVPVVDVEKPVTDVGRTAPTIAAAAATLLQKPVVSPGSAVLQANGKIDRHQYFKLGTPPRLVVDVYGVKPDFKERSFVAGSGMRRMRVGTYSDKTRLVFDAESDNLPGYEVTRGDSHVEVVWGEHIQTTSQKPEAASAIAVAAPPKPVKRVATAVSPVTVEALDFKSEKGKSVFSVRLNQATEVLQSTQTGDVVRFGVNNALLSQKLRRTVDASAFPSAVKLITPYTVQSGNTQEVRFAVELKGPVSYSVETSGSTVNFIVDDGPFAETRAQGTGTQEVLLPTGTNGDTVAAAPIAAPQSDLDAVLAASAEAVQPSIVGMQSSESVISASEGSYRIAEEKAGYSGEKISLVFDNADIRKILQLIAEVSNLNIIASDEVKGSITLRLQEVPWDQALDLIMDIQDLGMVRDGNIARIMPRNRIRAMEEAKLTAKRTKEKLEDLVTEVISISYTDLGNIEKPAKDLLTERGKITKDDRNKQIIVTDIPSVIADVRNLVAILDTPERQVMIEARIVEADSSFSRDLGVNWGFTSRDKAADADVSQELRLGLGGGFLLTPPVAGGSGSSGLASSMTFGQLGTDTTLLDLRISAIETSGHGKVISTPRVTTLNGEKAKISQGTQIPYVVQSDSGPNTEFVEAALSLEVTPVINPDGSIILEIKATNSTPGTTVSTGTGGSAPSINSKEAETKVLVQDGETTVLGGIFVEDEDYSDTGVPWLSKVPIIGHLFKSTKDTSSRSELLVFITPRILQ